MTSSSTVKQESRKIQATKPSHAEMQGLFQEALTVKPMPTGPQKYPSHLPTPNALLQASTTGQPSPAIPLPT